jgi:cytochrome P450
VPVLVIGDMLGLPAEDATRLERWSAALAGFLGASSMTPEIVGAALQAVVELEGYLREQIERRRSAPGDDLLSELLAAHEQDDRLDEAELLATCTMVLFGGHETTTNLIGNGVKVLLEHPAELAALREDLAGRIAPTVEELLRFEPPVLRMGRIAKQPVALGSAEIAAGDRVYMVMAAANRDPAQFEAPARFDPSRAENRHLTFGHGRHYCLGAALGRVEGQIALAKLVARFPALRLVDEGEPRWLDNLTVRGLEQLPVALA